MHPILWLGLGLLVGSSGKKEAERKAAVQENEMLRAAEKFVQQFQNLKRQQRQQWLPLVIRTALRSQGNTQGVVTSNAYQLEKQLRLPPETLYNQLDFNWTKYFNTPKTLQANGDFTGQVF